MFVPTVVFYLPEKDKSAHLIGKFDKATILKHQEKFVTGKLATFPMKTKARDLEIKDLDCSHLMPEIDPVEESSQDKDLEDEILKEILREDEERRKKREKEEADIKKRGGKAKKKKKDKKKPAKEDL